MEFSVLLIVIGIILIAVGVVVRVFWTDKTRWAEPWTITVEGLEWQYWIYAGAFFVFLGLILRWRGF